MKKPSIQKTTLGEFRKLAEDLMVRGFVEEEKPHGVGVLPEGMLVASYKREIADFILKVGASQDASDALAMRGRGLEMNQAGANLWAKAHTRASAGRNVAELTIHFPYKLHYVDANGAYHASLVPFSDPSLLIDSCLKVGTAIGKLGRDQELTAAVDAKEVLEGAEALRKKVRPENSFSAYLNNYMMPLIDSMAQKMKYEFGRIGRDADILVALNQIADRDA